MKAKIRDFYFLLELRDRSSPSNMLGVNNRLVALYLKIHVICKCRDKGDAAIKKGLSINCVLLPVLFCLPVSVFVNKQLLSSLKCRL